MPNKLNYEKKQSTVYIDKDLKKAVKKELVNSKERTNLSVEIEKLLLKNYLKEENIEEFLKKN